MQEQETGQPVNLSDDTSVAAELAKPENVELYVEQRTEEEAAPAQNEQEAVDRVLDKPEKKKASRYERLKRAVCHQHNKVGDEHDVRREQTNPVNTALQNLLSLTLAT